MTKVQTAAGLIPETALEALARVHGATVAEVVAGLAAGHVNLCAQFHMLAERGAAEAVTLHDQGRISLT